MMKPPGKRTGTKRLTDYKTPMGETLRQPRCGLSVLLFFLYVGAEGSLGTWTYSLLIESRGIRPSWRGYGLAVIGPPLQLAGLWQGCMPNVLGLISLVQGSVVVAFLGAVLLWWNPSQWTNLLAVALMGFAIAPIFPALMSGTSQRVGEHFAANTIGMQMAAAGLGSAVIPSLVGVLARRISLEIVPVCLVILFAGLFGVYRSCTAQ